MNDRARLSRGVEHCGGKSVRFRLGAGVTGEDLALRGGHFYLPRSPGTCGGKRAFRRVGGHEKSPFPQRVNPLLRERKRPKHDGAPVIDLRKKAPQARKALVVGTEQNLVLPFHSSEQIFFDRLRFFERLVGYIFRLRQCIRRLRFSFPRPRFPFRRRLFVYRQFSFCRRLFVRFLHRTFAFSSAFPSAATFTIQNMRRASDTCAATANRCGAFCSFTVFSWPYKHTCRASCPLRHICRWHRQPEARRGIAGSRFRRRISRRQ